jgi:hypothetical protein
MASPLGTSRRSFRVSPRHSGREGGPRRRSQIWAGPKLGPGPTVLTTTAWAAVSVLAAGVSENRAAPRAGSDLDVRHDDLEPVELADLPRKRAGECAGACSRAGKGVLACVGVRGGTCSRMALGRAGMALGRTSMALGRTSVGVRGGTCSRMAGSLASTRVLQYPIGVRCEYPVSTHEYPAGGPARAWRRPWRDGPERSPHSFASAPPAAPTAQAHAACTAHACSLSGNATKWDCA